uniref:Pentatricopeptide repeat-containing protein At5g46460, mitochondrial n=1 Tax=Anthurium amnicola TaxID=1678845 RepID=A0A1D1ZJZ1_9ARAE
MKLPNIFSFPRNSLFVVHRRKPSFASMAAAAERNTTRHGVSSPSPSRASVLSRLVGTDNLEEARRVFDGILPFPDVYHYTIMITGYARAGRLREALRLFEAMPARDLASWNSMVKGCFECGDLLRARHIFDQMPERNAISWTTMLDGLARARRIGEAEELFWSMPLRDVVAWNSMIFGYCQNGRTADAHVLFKKMPCPNVISWTTMIGGMEKNGKSEEAQRLFQRMSASGVKPTSSTFACVLTACTNLKDLGVGSQVHGMVVKLGCLHDSFVSASLVTFYAACKLIDNACKVFLEDGHKTVVTWTALLTGYCSNGRYHNALDLLNEMMLAGVKPNQSTFTSALNSCCELEDLDKGKVIHASTVKVGLDVDEFVGNSLIVLYSKCGDMDDALAVFDSLSTRNLVSWNSVIVGCAQNGWGQCALKLYEDMSANLVRPDEITYVGLLTACSHSGMLEKGKHFFHLLNQEPYIKVNLEHYVCMVDILGRSGNFDEAEDFINNMMPLKYNSTVWLALLSACRVHSNVEAAGRIAQYIFDLDPHNSAAYVLLSNVHASLGRWNDVSQIRTIMKFRGTVKIPGYSWITLKGSKHGFVCGDMSHPLRKELYRMLDWLAGKLKESGYVTDKRFALHDVDDEQKDVILSLHSEKLAVAFGLINTVEGSVIRVMKNIRVCGDCHSAIKLISKIVNREIVLRDPSRFHHFSNGSCSCGDYW